MAAPKQVKQNNELATISKKKSGSGYNLLLKQGVTLDDGRRYEAGTYLFMQTPSEEINDLVSRGFITESQGEERLGKVPDFIKYKVSVPKDPSKATVAGKVTKKEEPTEEIPF